MSHKQSLFYNINCCYAIGYSIALEGDNKLIGWCVSIDWMANNYSFINLYIIKEKKQMIW